MRRLIGVGASPGIAIGPAFPIDVRVAVSETNITFSQIEPEIARFDRALAAADAQLVRLQNGLFDRDNSQGSDIIEAHRLMLKSTELVGGTRRRIREDLVGAEWALCQTLDRIRAAFDRIRDPYLRERGADIDALGQQLLRALLEMPELQSEASAPVGSLVVGKSLSPLGPISLKRAGIAGVATEGGGRTSHAAILARAMGLPYIVGVERLSTAVHRGDVVIVDGGTGEVIINPDDATRQLFERRVAAELERTIQLQAVLALPTITLDGHAIALSANVESLAELEDVVKSGATSVGLFRTEFLYLERADLPSEEEQYRDAVAALRVLRGRPATFRTFDLGADKLSLAVSIPEGPNPALGVRSIRFSLHRPDIFRTQLRALYRAAAVGPLRILFPLISGVTELIQVRAICREVCRDLEAEGVPHDPNTPLGVMIETPSAALTVDHLAAQCDFLSIGTNDLIQFAFAADRENEHVSHLYHPLHPAVLRSLKQIVDAARAASIPVAVCGDIAGDPALTWILLGLGLTDLSMAPGDLAIVKMIIRGSTLAEATALTKQALSLASEVEIEALVRSAMRARFGPDIIRTLPTPPVEAADTVTAGLA